MEHAPGTVAFFQAMAPVLIANVLTAAFVYSFAKIQQKGARGRGGRSPTYMWLIVLVFSFMPYGFYTWGVYPLKPKFGFEQ
jgi:hypothetical protein